MAKSHSVYQFYLDVRKLFPVVAKVGDHGHAKWSDNTVTENNDLAAYSWFECLAKQINVEMGRSGTTAPDDYRDFFNYVAAQLGPADEALKRCIDVALCEELFAGVRPERAAPFWELFPLQLRSLYLSFHGAPPI